MSSIHGHEVMHMMLESAQPYTENSLKAAIIRRFGAEARFHTCSAENMDADQLISFLAKKGKFTPEGEGFVTQPSKICQH